MKHLRLFCLLSLAALVACLPDEVITPTVNTPRIDSMRPSHVAPGDTVTIFGQGFKTDSLPRILMSDWSIRRAITVSSTRITFVPETFRNDTESIRVVQSTGDTLRSVDGLYRSFKIEPQDVVPGSYILVPGGIWSDALLFPASNSWQAPLGGSNVYAVPLNVSAGAVSIKRALGKTYSAGSITVRSIPLSYPKVSISFAGVHARVKVTLPHGSLQGGDSTYMKEDDLARTIGFASLSSEMHTTATTLQTGFQYDGAALSGGNTSETSSDDLTVEIDENAHLIRHLVMNWYVHLWGSVVVTDYAKIELFDVPYLVDANGSIVGQLTAAEIKDHFTLHSLGIGETTSRQVPPTTTALQEVLSYTPGATVSVTLSH